MIWWMRRAEVGKSNVLSLSEEGFIMVVWGKRLGKSRCALGELAMCLLFCPPLSCLCLVSYMCVMFSGWHVSRATTLMPCSWSQICPLHLPCRVVV